MGGLIAAQPIHAEHVTFILTDLARLPYARISIRPNPRLGDVWAAATSHIRTGLAAIPRLAHVLDLDGGFDEVWTKRFSGQTRKTVRKAEKSGIVVECDTTGRLMPVFYDLLRLSFDRWAARQREPALLARLRGHQRDSLEKFRVIARSLKDACRVWVAWINGQPAAAIVVLQYHNVNDARGAMDKDLVAQTGANDLIQKLAIEAACQSGCRYYHMGESGSSAGLAHFKERFGAVPYPYAEYYLERFPFTRLDRGLRTLVKKLIGFKDA
jgi:lipid II:glycine glycyltransferase (peptidoglycan interpeptide bridge formation enzyme)